MKTLNENFIDWESNTFGYGYGTGEVHIIPALKAFFNTFQVEDDIYCYDYLELESAVSPTVAWLLINTLCHHSIDIIDYGTSPRFAWLTNKGIALYKYLETKTSEELIELCTSRTEDYIVCYPDSCNCGLKGYQEGVKCPNPFWGT